ncbi:galectin-3b isoform X3 [Anguilla anguilla]|nr:galectin-3b isoform X3 [Anguilla anguilla]
MNQNNLWGPPQNGQNSGAPVWPGQPNQPMWPGQPNQPMWPGQPNQPMWPGQPNQTPQPAWPGQPNQTPQPAWPGQPNQPPTLNPAQDPPQEAPPKVPYDLKLPNGVHDKMLITIKGQVKPKPNKFTVNLSRGKDIALHFNPRFNEHGKAVIVRNSLVGGRWGREERALSQFPFAPEQPFELKILCTPSEYKVAVNKAHLLEYKHRIPELNQVTCLGIYDDITLTSVNVEKLP